MKFQLGDVTVEAVRHDRARLYGERRIEVVDLAGRPVRSARIDPLGRVIERTCTQRLGEAPEHPAPRGVLCHAGPRDLLEGVATHVYELPEWSGGPVAVEVALRAGARPRRGLVLQAGGAWWLVLLATHGLDLVGPHDLEADTDDNEPAEEDLDLGGW